MIDLSKVSCCLITKDELYPSEILNHLITFSFGEILILTHSDSPYRKHELFAKAKFDFIYYQDDDAICPVKELAEQAQPDIINVAIKDSHFKAYANTRMTMGIGWGSLFPKSVLQSLDRYTEKFGVDEVYKRETERILTFLNFPQNRLVLPIVDLPSAYAPDRLWRQPQHLNNIKIVEERCNFILSHAT